MELWKGRPLDSQGRTEPEMRVYDLLDELGMEYWRTDHEAIATMEGSRQIDDVLEAVVCKNLFLCNKQQTAFYLLMLPGDKKFKTAEFSKLIGSTRLGFAPPEKMTEFLDLYPGSVSVMGLMNDTGHRVQLVVDREVTQGEFIGCHPCVNTSSLKLRTDELFEKFLPAVEHSPIYVSLSRDD